MPPIVVTRTDGTRVRLDDGALQRFRAAFAGVVLDEGDADFDAACQIWNAMIEKRPALVAQCTGAADVREALAFAVREGLPVAIRGGGHHIAGHALCHGGLMIDLSRMRGVHVDPAARIVRVGPGCTWAEVDRETQMFGLAVPSGVISTTGVAGLTLGAGFGWISRKFGYTCDNLRSVDIITADGQFRRASATENADLFWAVRGGGGNFGIVTSFEFAAQPVGPEVIGGLIAYPFADVRAVARFFREFSANAPRELATLLVVRTAPPAPFIPAQYHGTLIAAMAVCHIGPLDAGEKAVAPLKEFGTPIADAIGPMPFVAHQQLFDATAAAGHRCYWKSDFFTEASDEFFAALVDRARTLTSPLSAILLFHLGGAIGDVPADATAAGHRDAEFVVNIEAMWDESADDYRHMQWTRDTWAAIHPFSSGGGYVNFLSGDEGPPRTEAAYGPANYRRLVALKNRYDPANVFRLNQNIAPDSTSADASASEAA